MLPIDHASERYFADSSEYSPQRYAIGLLTIPKGILNALATFNHLKTQVFRPHRGTNIFVHSCAEQGRYFTDIFVHCCAEQGRSDVDNHIERYEQLLQCMQMFKLYANQFNLQ